MTKLIRGRVRDNLWTDQQVIWQAPAAFYRVSNIHYGTRLLFLGGKLFFSIGDRGQRDEAQNLSSPLGKIHRINPDGTIPIDNPFIERSGAYPSIWSYGHRNPQGLAIDPRDGTLWETEHGPRGGDELNIIKRGHNYGWPVVTHGVDDDGSVISDLTTASGMDNPAAFWTPSIAPSAIEFYAATIFPRWRNQILLGSLAAQQLRRIQTAEHTVVGQEILWKNLGRIRDIHTGQDGYVYLAIERYDKNGEILRLLPAQ